MAEAKAEVMEEIEDGRDEGEEEDAVDATSVRPGRVGAGEGQAPAGLGSCEGAPRGAGRVPFCVSPAWRSQAPMPQVT